MLTRIAVFVSGGGTNLQAILNEESHGRIRSGKVVLVVSTNEHAGALKRSEYFGVKTCVVNPKECASEAEYNQKLFKVLDENNVNLIVLAGYLHILDNEFVRRYPQAIINIHPSLIPAFCGKGYYGLKVHEEVLKRGVKVTGATVHFVNEIPDGGEIIMQRAVAIRNSDTPEILQRRVMEKVEWVILPKAVELVSRSILLGKKCY